MSTWRKVATSGGCRWLYLEKNYDTWELPIIELIEMVEKHNSLITINDGTYFCILEYLIQSLY